MYKSPYTVDHKSPSFQALQEKKTQQGKTLLKQHVGAPSQPMKHSPEPAHPSEPTHDQGMKTQLVTSKCWTQQPHHHAQETSSGSQFHRRRGFWEAWSIKREDDDDWVIELYWAMQGEPFWKQGLNSQNRIRNCEWEEILKGVVVCHCFENLDLDEQVTQHHN